MLLPFVRIRSFKEEAWGYCHTHTFLLLPVWIASNRKILWDIDTLCLPFMIICLFVYVVGWVAEFFFLRALHERYKD